MNRGDVVMSWLSRITNVFRSDRLDQDLDDEQRFHLEARADELEERANRPHGGSVAASSSASRAATCR